MNSQLSPRETLRPALRNTWKAGRGSPVAATATGRPPSPPLPAPPRSPASLWGGRPSATGGGGDLHQRTGRPTPAHSISRKGPQTFPFCRTWAPAGQKHGRGAVLPFRVPEGHPGVFPTPWDLLSGEAGNLQKPAHTASAGASAAGVASTAFLGRREEASRDNLEGGPGGRPPCPTVPPQGGPRTSLKRSLILIACQRSHKPLGEIGSLDAQVLPVNCPRAASTFLDIHPPLHPPGCITTTPFAAQVPSARTGFATSKTEEHQEHKTAYKMHLKIGKAGLSLVRGE